MFDLQTGGISLRKLIIVTLALAAAMLTGSGTSAAKPEKHRHHHHFQGASSHQAMYMQLLADRYAPETSGEWKKVYQERKRLMEAIKSRDDESRGSLRQEMKRLFHDSEGKMKGHMQTMKQFTQAVESGDEKQIRDVLPKMLEAERQFNNMLAEAIQNTQKK
jgi:flagellar hook-basal body complex protein FliE